MPSDHSRLTIITMVIGALVFISLGIGPTPTSGEPNPDTLVAEAVESMQSDPISGVRTTEIEQPGVDIEQTVEIQELPPGYTRLEILGSSTASAGQEIVINEKAGWGYIENEEVTVRYENGTLPDDIHQLGTAPEDVLEYYDSTYRGETQYDGRRVYVVALTPPDRTQAALSLDFQAGGVTQDISLYEASADVWYVAREVWWIDAETYHPVKKHIEWTNPDGSVVATATQRYDELTVGADIETEAPEFQPETGSNDTVVVDSTTYTNRTAAEDAAQFDLPLATLPTGHTFESATVRHQNGSTSTMLTYGLGSSSITIEMSQGWSSVSTPFAVRVAERQLNEFDGRILITDSGATVVRHCDEFSYRVRGLPNADRLIDITGSLKC